MIQPVGYIKLWRDIFTKPIWLNSSPVQKTVLITILGMVNFQPSQWEWMGKKFILKPGQVVTSLENIKSNCGKQISFQNVRTSLKRFENLDFLTNESTKTGRLITIVNWHLYQVDVIKTNKGDNKDLTKTSQRPNKDLTTKEEGKNNKNIKVLFVDDSQELYFSKKLFELIRINNPEAKEPNFQNWAKEMDLILRIDKRSADSVAKVISWSQKDSFWKNNILSTKKLREKYDQLSLKMNTPITQQIPQQTPQHQNFQQRDYDEDLFKKFSSN
jgi:hypothetical protein